MGNTELCTIRLFTERDIHLFLAEELRINLAFAAWFVSRVGGAPEMTYPAYRTVIEDHLENGESDVVAHFATNAGGNHALLIEDKIEHTLSADQLNRYVRRGEYGIKSGR